MQAPNSFDQLGCVETCSTLTEPVFLTQMPEKLTTVEEIHNEVQLCFRLESIVQLNDERTINFLKDISFSLSLDQKIPLGDDILS